MTLCGLADYRLNDFGEVIELYNTCDEAEAALLQVLSDEPDWACELGVVAVEFVISPQ
jgi:hypothetical protein